MLGSLTGRLLGLPRRCPEDEARAPNARMAEMCANPFWRTQACLAPRHPFLNHVACNERANQRPEPGEHPTYQIKHF